ncbi:tetratricopeptide repeat protein [Streptomyces sp. NPDC059850]|uniref:tetratricopeptide repeat protein n=1 Tax=Streptomyces sp. NPDC059850 TaxID=3346970 RepID=UPI003658901F
MPHIPPRRGDHASTANTLSGPATVGTSIQARDIHSVTVHTSPPPRLPVPRQLRPVSATFTDRETELRHLAASLADEPRTGARIAAISGIAGVGKTAFAERLLHELSAEFPGGQLQVNLRGLAPDGPATAVETLGRLLRALWPGELCGDAEELAAWWRSITAQHPPLAVLLDDAATAHQVRTLLPGGAGHVVVVTSRDQLAGLLCDGAVFCHMLPLDPDSTEHLLTRFPGTERLPRREVRRLAVRTGGIPLAVTVTATHLATIHTNGRNDDMDSWSGDPATSGRHHQAVARALDSAYKALPPSAARVYRLSASLPALDIDPDMVAAACVLPREQAVTLLEALAAAHQLEERGHLPGRTGPVYRFHDAVRDHARAHEDAGRPEAVRRLLDWYLVCATDAERRLTPSHCRLERDYVYLTEQIPFTDDAGARAWLDAQHHNLMEGVRHAETAGIDTMACQLPHAMWPWWRSHHHYALWDEAHTIAVRAARRCGAREAERVLLNTRGVGLRSSGRHQDAADCFSEVLALSDAADDQRMQAQAFYELGVTHYATSRADEAEPLLIRAREMRLAQGDRRGAALAEIILGCIRLEAPNIPAAMDHFITARSILTDCDPFDAARALAWLGRAHALIGDYPEAVRQLNQAKTEFQATDSARWVARTLEMLGQTAQEQGHIAHASQHFAAALERFDQINPHDAERVRQRLGQLAT